MMVGLVFLLYFFKRHPLESIRSIFLFGVNEIAHGCSQYHHHHDHQHSTHYAHGQHYLSERPLTAALYKY